VPKYEEPNTLRIPSDSVHPFRSNPYSCSDVFVHLVEGVPAAAGVR
jgi:hypothetical protein